MICKNCQQEFEGNYCNHCGQKATVRRLDASYLFNEVPNSLFQLNRGFFFTVKEILFRPGHAIRSFIEGKRKPYYQPVAFLLVVSTLYVLLNYFLGANTIVEDIIEGFEEGANNDNNKSADGLAITWLSQYQVYLPLFILPLFSIASYLTFRKSGYNYMEHLVLNIYVTAQQFIIFLIFNFFISQGSNLVLIQFVVGIIFVFWTYIQFFHQKKLLPKLGLIVLTYVLFVFFFMTTLVMVAGVWKMLMVN